MTVQPDRLPANLSHIHKLLVASFDQEELRTLCLDLSVRFDDLGGEGVSGKARELLLLLERTKQIEALLVRLEELRPRVGWREGPAVGTECPYKGLHAFHEADADNFFGREAFTQKLVGAAANQSLVAVVGPSGSGKSSVVYAGLVPVLRRDGVWQIIHFRPGSDPFLGLGSALLPVLNPDLDPEDIKHRARKLKNYLGGVDKEERVPLADYLAQMREANPAAQLLLIVDQFEELYTQVEADVRRDFLDVLLAPGFGTAAHPFATLLLTMRADFMGQALAYPPMVAALQNNDVKIGLMANEELRLAIEQPAKNQGVRFAEGLVGRILADVGDHAGNLPLLEFALTLLWERQSGGELSHAAYEAIGGVRGALAQHADETLAKLTQEDPERAGIIQRVMVQLVQPGTGAEDTRRVARKSDLGEVGWTLAQRLAAEDARLLVTGRHEGQLEAAETVEVIHEALIQNWGQLKAWMEQDREFRMWQERLRSDLALWQSRQAEAYLLRGGPLTVAGEWLEKQRHDLGKEEIAFIEASAERQQAQEAAEEARQKRELEQAQQLAEEQTKARNRLRYVAGVLLGGLILAAVLTVSLIGANQNVQKNAQIAEENAGTAEANEIIAVEARETSDANAAALIDAIATSEAETERAENAEADAETRADEAAVAQEAAEAAQDEAETQARLAEARALAAEANQWLGANEVNRGLVLAYQAVSATYGVDGVVANEAHSALVNSLAQVRANTVLEGHTASVWSAAFSPDGTRIVTTSYDGTARLWDADGGLITVLEGHTAGVLSAAFNPDGTRIVTASYDGTARLWDADGGLITVLEGHTAGVLSAAFNPDGTRIVTASDDGTARLWDADGGLITVLEGHTAGVLSAAFNPDGTRIVTASDDRTARLWDADGGLITVLEGHTDWVLSAAFNPDGTRIVTASYDGTARLWDADGGLITVLEGHTTRVLSAAFNPDGTRIVTASDDGTARLWDADGGLITVLEGHTASVWSAAFNPDGTRIVTASSDGTARLWDADGGLITVLEGHTAGVLSAAFNPDGTRIVTASDDRTARLWDADGGLITVLEGHTDWVLSAAFNPDGTRIVTASSDGTARLWDADGGLITVLEGHTAGVLSAAFNPDGTRIVTASDDRTARLWDADGGLITVLEGHTDWVLSAAFNPDGTRIVTASSDGTARLWDADGGLITVLEGHILSAAFNPDGTRIVTASSDGTARLWDADGGLITVLEGHTDWVLSAAFNPDGTRIVTASSDGTARLWDADGGLITVLEGHTDRVRSAAFNPDGTRIVTASYDGTARLWDADGGLITVLEGHTTRVLSAAFNPDGTRIVTASSDGTARLWDADGGLITVLEGHTDWVLSAAFNPDGTRIVTASYDGTARLWRTYATFEEMLAEAERKLRVVLTAAECAQYFAEFDPAFCAGWEE